MEQSRFDATEQERPRSGSEVPAAAGQHNAYRNGRGWWKGSLTSVIANSAATAT